MASKDDISTASSSREMEHYSSACPAPSQTDTSNTSVDQTTLPVSLPPEQDLDANQDCLVHAFGQLDIENQLLMAERMFAQLGRVFRHAVQAHHIDLGAPDWHNRLRQADENSRQGNRDTEALRWIRTVLEQLRTLDSEDLVEAANVLANASRDASWRSPFGQSGLLEFFLRLSTAEDGGDALLAPALRFVGNTCADTDVNREMAISPEYIQRLIDHLHDSELTALTISVIYNICNHYERAQHAFRTSGLCSALINVLTNPSFEAGPLLPYICTLLDFSTHQSDLSSCPEESLQTVLQLLQEPEVDPSDILLIVNTANAFLQQQRFQRQFVDQEFVDILLEVIVRSYSFETESPGAEEELAFLRNSINQTLSDISATGLFGNKYPLNSRLVGSLIHWLSSSREQMRICSCLMLGNLARSDPVCLDMVRRLRLHEKLFQILQDQSDIQVTYAALGFLRNLALPAENKQIIGTLQSMEVISSFWSLDLNPQVQHASVGFLRQLLNNCIGNVRWLLESLSPDQDSPANEKTYLSLLLLLFGRTDDMSTKVEIGRTVATICRCIASASQGLPPESISAILHRLYAMHADIARPLAMMITQNRFLIIRSEGWFALALMARSKEGSAAVSEVLQQMEVFGALVTTITGQPTNGHGSPTNQRPTTGNTSSSGSGSDARRPSSEQERDMQTKDRENALVLVNELLKNTGDELSVIRRSILEELMRGPQSPEGAQELITRAQSEDQTE